MQQVLVPHVMSEKGPKWSSAVMTRRQHIPGISCNQATTRPSLLPTLTKDVYTYVITFYMYVAIPEPDLRHTPARQLATCQTVHKSSFQFTLNLTLTKRLKLSTAKHSYESHIPDKLLNILNTSMPPKVNLQALSLCSSFVKAISVNEEHVKFAYQRQRHLAQI